MHAAIPNAPAAAHAGALVEIGRLLDRWSVLLRLRLPVLDPGEVATRADLAADYIVSAQLPDGMFAYEYDFAERRFVDKNNIVRQAGAGFALAEYLNQPGAERHKPSVERAIAVLAAKSIPYEDGLVVADDGGLAEAKTGATALALLGELNYHAATDGDRFAETRQGWLKALARLQLPSGGFASRPGSDTESHYFNGESWLALSEFARLFPGGETARAALAKADPYLMQRYSEVPQVSFFHWGARAAAVRYDATAEGRFLTFIEGQAEVYLSKLRPKMRRHVNGGGAVEGLAAAATALAKGGHTRTRLYRRIVKRTVSELKNAFDMQIMPGQDSIAIDDRRIALPVGICFKGAFLNGRQRPQTRIDFTQHCLSAMLKYGALQQAVKGAVRKPRGAA